jgi:hypothetical protein
VQRSMCWAENIEIVDRKKGSWHCQLPLKTKSLKS